MNGRWCEIKRRVVLGEFREWLLADSKVVKRQIVTARAQIHNGSRGHLYEAFSFS